MEEEAHIAQKSGASLGKATYPTPTLIAVLYATTVVVVVEDLLYLHTCMCTTFVFDA